MNADGQATGRMGHEVCPWWVAYLIDNPLRRLIHKPEAIFRNYVKPGDTVLDLGCGIGFAALPLAKIVGDQGRVIAVDLQQKMLAILQRRAVKAGLGSRIQTHRCEPGSIGIATPVDFAVAFWMVHEVPDSREFLAQVRCCLKPDARFLVTEPIPHVRERAFRETLDAAQAVGLVLREQPRIRGCRTALFSRSPAEPSGVSLK